MNDFCLMQLDETSLNVATASNRHSIYMLKLIPLSSVVLITGNEGARFAGTRHTCCSTVFQLTVVT